ncbi:phage tail assembly chaperone [Pectobacterium betavasculorum]|uniref:phage tail assembly chaperone n=1 Tax=Pectobacterium betavasculorum TaxID=55207 RepID=UPI00313D84AC
MANKFQLQPKPTFKVDVSIPRAGDDDGVITFTFKHKPLKELSAIEAMEGKNAVDFLIDITEAWALPDEFNRDNLETLLDNYPRALESVTKAYYDELMANRQKN